MPDYSVVVPVYNSEKSLVELYTRVRKVFDEEVKKSFELILVDDSSKDASFLVMNKLSESDNRVRPIQLARNCGQHPAILCGFSYAKGKYIITMDDDLQHPPEEITKLIDKIISDDCDVVIGRYISKKHGLIRNIGTRISNYISYKAYGKPKDLELTSFRIMKKYVVEDILSLNIDSPRIGNMILQVNGNIRNVYVEHDERKYGKSGYTFSRLIKDLVSNLITNSNFPLLCVRDIGIASFVASFFLGAYYLIRYFVRGTGIVGWTTLTLLILFYSGILLFAVGVIGDYLIKILNEAKKMPKFFVRRNERE